MILFIVVVVFWQLKHLIFERWEKIFFSPWKNVIYQERNGKFDVT